MNTKTFTLLIIAAIMLLTSIAITNIYMLAISEFIMLIIIGISIKKIYFKNN